MPDHCERQAGQAEIAAEGGAGRRHAQDRGRADGSTARSAPPGAAAPLPQGDARLLGKRRCCRSYWATAV
jgi:hypothetical protein